MYNKNKNSSVQLKHKTQFVQEIVICNLKKMSVMQKSHFFHKIVTRFTKQSLLPPNSHINKEATIFRYNQSSLSHNSNLYHKLLICITKPQFMEQNSKLETDINRKYWLVLRVQIYKKIMVYTTNSYIYHKIVICATLLWPVQQKVNCIIKQSLYKKAII